MEDKASELFIVTASDVTGTMRIVRAFFGERGWPELTVIGKFRLGRELRLSRETVNVRMIHTNDSVFSVTRHLLGVSVALGWYLSLYAGTENEPIIEAENRNIFDCSMLGVVIGIFLAREKAWDFAGSCTDDLVLAALQEKAYWPTAHALLELRGHPRFIPDTRAGLSLPALQEISNEASLS